MNQYLLVIDVQIMHKFLPNNSELIDKRGHLYNYMNLTPNKEKKY